MNKYRSKINVTIEVKVWKFFETKIINNKGNTTEIFRKTSKLPMHWLSRVPKQYKWNALIWDLHRTKRISSNFEMQINVIKRKFPNTDYPPKFFNSIINQFLTPNIAIRLFFHLSFLKRLHYLFWLKYQIVKKLEAFTNHSYRIAIK